MAIAESWHIRSRARHCAATERPFTEGEKIVTALFPDPDSSGYLRKDFSLEAWQARPPDADPPFSFWRATYEPPVHHEKEDPMKKEDPESLLRRLVEEDEEHTENVRYILAVMLERKKILRETDSQRTPNGILRVYEHRKEGDVFIVRDPDIPLDQIESVQTEVLDLLENSGRRPEPPADEPAGNPPGDPPSGTPTDEDPPADLSAAAEPPTETRIAGDPPLEDQVIEEPPQEAPVAGDSADEPSVADDRPAGTPPPAPEGAPAPGKD